MALTDDNNVNVDWEDEIEPLSREEILEHELQQAISTIEFLHGCLTNPVFRYDYPEQTEDFLRRLSDLVPERKFCIHSKTHIDCDSCVQRVTYYQRKAITDV